MSAGSPWPLPSDRLETRLPDRKPLYSAWEAETEAARCLYCHDAPCTAACPTKIDVPAFIHQIATGNPTGAARTILRANLLGLSCARVCPVGMLCEGACVYAAWKRAAVAIGRLQRYAMEKGDARGRLRAVAAPAGSPARAVCASDRATSIGLVGAGPASLACAGTLALLGHATVIYEKAALPGGLNTTGIAPYKLWAEDALAEVEFIRSLGVEIRTGVEIGAGVAPGDGERSTGVETGRSLSGADLLQRHAAVFLGPGLGMDSSLGIPGEDGSGVAGGAAWIRRLKIDPSLSLTGVRRAVVVGGGNTAVDVSQELVALGVEEVTLVYRRSRQQMRAYPHELAAAREAGVVLLERATVTEVLREGGRVTALRIVDTEDGVPTDRIRAVIAADLVVVAIGQAKLRRLVEGFPGVACDERGRIVADPETGATGNPRVFAGGDAVNGGKEVVNAVDAGQRAARAIHAMLWGGAKAGAAASAREREGGRDA